MTQFEKLGLIEPIRRALRAENYTEPTPIQAGAIPQLLAGRDLLGVAQTGTGKTAAFALPMLQLLSATGGRPRGRTTRSLVLVPTRELAAQVADAFRTYGQFLKMSVAVIYGGVGQGSQVRQLAGGVDVLVATPGRLLDLMQQGHLQLTAIEFFVLDEVDQMLDLGFVNDIKKILRVLPKRRQNVFLSATMPTPIAKLADSILSNPAKVTVTPVASTVEKVTQSVHLVDRSRKVDLLCNLLAAPEVERVLVFTRTKRGADRVARDLNRHGLRADAIHGNKSQNTRERTLASFRTGRTRILVATDIAARGIDIDEISHVVNFELPNVPEVYVHRIGRTARAGASGIAISLCDETERAYLRDIERLIKFKLPVALRPGEREPAGIRPAKADTHEPRPARAPVHHARAPVHHERAPVHHARIERRSEPRAPRGPHRIEHDARERRAEPEPVRRSAGAHADAPHRRDAAAVSPPHRRGLAAAGETNHRDGAARHAPRRAAHTHAARTDAPRPRAGAREVDRHASEHRPLRPHHSSPRSHGAPTSGRAASGPRHAASGPRHGGRGSHERHR